MRCVADLGVKPTTDAAQIGEFLAKRRSRPALVISTHQSCDRVAKGQATAKKKFGLTICDEAHRLVGRVDGHFATVLDEVVWQWRSATPLRMADPLASRSLVFRERRVSVPAAGFYDLVLPAGDDEIVRHPLAIGPPDVVRRHQP